ncbi:hypothetical protein ACHAW6_001020 [Cyclotella cf. meneghiniana]
MSQETMHIALLIAVLNDVDIWAADVLNAYITVACHEKITVTLGKEFAIINQALYGLKSSTAAFRTHLAGCLHKMGYHPCLADPDLWLKEQTDWKCNRYYAYILCYVDELLVVHHNPRLSWTGLTASFPSFLTQLISPRCTLGKAQEIDL